MDFYHVLNRGVEGRAIFPQRGDYIRFINGLYIFNDTRPAQNTRRDLEEMNDIGGRSLVREPLVDIHGWCIMKNHYHLLMSECVQNGMNLFVRKLNVGYAKYFNDKYQRSGYVFQGKTKKILIERDAHYLHILHYIHLNPLDYLPGAEQWRKRVVTHSARAEKYLDTYRWSSYLDYSGTKNFPSILSTSHFSPTPGEYTQKLRSYLASIDLASINELTLE